MFFSSVTIPRSCSALCLAAPVVALMALASLPALAQGTHLWTQSRLEDFQKGTAQGVALTSDGHLRAGPALTEKLTTPSTFVWSVAVGKDGTAYLATASPATVLRIGPDGKPFTLFETKDLSVQVVRLGPDGALYAATISGGKVYRLKPDATAKQDETSATVVFDAAKLDACLAKQDTAAIEASKKVGTALGVEATPSLFINGDKIDGAVPVEFIFSIIDDALRAQNITPPPPYVVPAPPAPTPAAAPAAVSPAKPGK